MSMTTTVGASHDGDMADHDPAQLRRRRFSPEYKLAILAEYDRLTEPSDKGALLRREGLYTSHIVEWRRARRAAPSAARTATATGPGCGTRAWESWSWPPQAAPGLLLPVVSGAPAAGLTAGKARFLGETRVPDVGLRPRGWSAQGRPP